MTPQTYKEQDFEEQISKKNYYHIFIEAATPNHIYHQ
jgi:hypothetical protein